VTPDEEPARAPAVPRGYTYLIGSTDAQYGSMTAAGLAALYALRAVLPAESEEIADLQHGIDCCVLWLEKNWTVRGVPPLTRPHVATRSTAKDGWGQLYFLYALERAGMLGGIERFGKRAWYEEGAWQLVSSQRADGSWGAGPIDTAFAILFLVRSTPPAPVTGE
jgi:hypothetical protein